MVAFAARPDLHPLDGSSGQVTQKTRGIYIVVVVFYAEINPSRTVADAYVVRLCLHPLDEP